VFYSYCWDVPQRPTTNNKHHNHGRRRRKWPSSALHEAIRPTPMHRSNPPSKRIKILRGLEEFLVNCHCVLLPLLVVMGCCHRPTVVILVSLSCPPCILRLVTRIMWHNLGAFWEPWTLSTPPQRMSACLGCCPFWSDALALGMGL